MIARNEAINALLTVIHEYQADLDKREAICSQHHRKCKKAFQLSYKNALIRSGLDYRKTAGDSISVGQITRVKFNVARQYSEMLYVTESYNYRRI